MRKKLNALVLIAALCAAGGTLGTAKAAAGDQKVSCGEMTTRQLLLLMDKDKNGKVSRKEFLDYMNAEFDRLDKNKDGELDAAELNQLHIGHSPGYPGAR